MAPADSYCSLNSRADEDNQLALICPHPYTHSDSCIPMRTDLNTHYTVLYYKQHYIQHDQHLMNFISKKSIFILKFCHRSKKPLTSLLYERRNEETWCWAVALSARVCLCVYVCLLCPSWSSASLLKIRLNPSKGGLDAVCSMYACVCVCSERCV